MTDPTDLDHAGAQDECASCAHPRHHHRAKEHQRTEGTCGPALGCGCDGDFVELSYGTRMARFVEAAQKLPPAMAAVRTAMTDAFRALHGLHAAMQQAGLLPEEEPGLCDGCDTVTQVTATDDGRAQMCDSCKRAMANAEREEAARATCPIDGAPLATAHTQAGRPTMYQHRDGFMHLDHIADLEVGHRLPALQQLATFHHVDCDGTDRTIGGACGGACTQGRSAAGFAPRGSIHYPPLVRPRTQDDLQGPVPDHEHGPQCVLYGCPEAQSAMAELVTTPQYAQHPEDTCPACYPYACDSGRAALCRRRPGAAHSTEEANRADAPPLTPNLGELHAAASTSCATCWPRPCDRPGVAYRSECRRREPNPGMPEPPRPSPEQDKPTA